MWALVTLTASLAGCGGGGSSGSSGNAATDSASAALAAARPAALAPAPVDVVPAALKVVTGNRTLYVSPSGSDNNDGFSEAKPLQTIQRGVDKAVPGDTVLVRNGTYTNADPRSNIVTLTRSGTPSAWIALKAYPGEKPLLKSANWTAIGVQASYVLVEGFKIVGNRDQVSLDYAMSQATNLDNPITSGNGIGITPVYGRPDVRSHHVVIRGNEVYDCSGGGIFSNQADYVLIESNTVSGNAWWSPYATSGVSVYQNWNSDDVSGYKMIVRGNKVSSNTNKIPFFYSSSDPAKRVISDGNGIIVDDARNTQAFSGNQGSPYKGRTLVDSNLIVQNGARGVNVFSSDHVDVVNNTTYQNAFQPETPDGEISIFDANDVRIFNNIVSARSDRPSLKRASASDPSRSAERASHAIGRNLVSRGTGFDAEAGDNLVGVDPQFVDPAANDFQVRANSPAIDAANSRYSFSTALYNAARYLGSGPDIGAFENR